MYNKLLNIKNMYESVLDITVKLVNDFNEDIIGHVFKKRASILSQIKNEETQLSLLNDKFKSQYPDIVNEIVNKINIIISMDKKIAEKLTENMDAIRLELSGLYKNSRAAAAYSVQKKN